VAKRGRDSAGNPDREPIGPKGAGRLSGWGDGSGGGDGTRPGTLVRWARLRGLTSPSRAVSRVLELQWSACSDNPCKRSTEPSPRKSWGWCGVTDARGAYAWAARMMGRLQRYEAQPWMQADLAGPWCIRTSFGQPRAEQAPPGRAGLGADAPTTWARTGQDASARQPRAAPKAAGRRPTAGNRPRRGSHRGVSGGSPPG
jgi:hypothetical protein